MTRTQKPSLVFIGFLQATGLTLYCSLVALVLWRGEKWFGPVTMPLGPIVGILLFATSALIAGLLTLGYPFYLLWEEKDTKLALRLVIATALWLVLLFFVFLLTLTVK